MKSLIKILPLLFVSSAFAQSVPKTEKPAVIDGVANEKMWHGVCDTTVNIENNLENCDRLNVSGFQ